MKYATQMRCVFARDMEYAVWGYLDGGCVGYRTGLCVLHRDGMCGVTEKGCMDYGVFYRNGVCSQ